MSYQTESDQQLKSLSTIFRSFLVIVAIIILPTMIFANDSVTRFGAGGIELIKAEDIRMLEEILEICSKKVRVRYRFVNDSQKDIDATIGFPLPHYPPYSGPGANNPSSASATFKVWVNGQPVSTEWDCRAVLDGADITTQLRELGLSEEQIFHGVDLRQDQAAAAEKLGGGKMGNDLYWETQWMVAETRLWQQKFPAGKEVIVEHEYEPVTGHGYAPVPSDVWAHFSGKNGVHEDCLDERTKQAIENRVKKALSKGSEAVTVWYTSVEYILGTGRNWKGPIGEFKLRLAKEKPEQFVSLCFPGKFTKISPTVYEFYQKDFVPQDKLVVYFYTVGSQE